MGLHSDGRLQAMPANIRPGWKWMATANTLAYYNTETITAIKSFMLQGPRDYRLLLLFTFFQNRECLSISFYFSFYDFLKLKKIVFFCSKIEKSTNTYLPK
jgi:hypothetical protein